MATRATRSSRSRYATDGTPNRRTAAASPNAPGDLSGIRTFGDPEPGDAAPESRRVTRARLRRRRRRRRMAVLVLLLVAAALVAVDLVRDVTNAEPAAPPQAQGAANAGSVPDPSPLSTAVTASPTVATVSPTAIPASYPVTGPGSFGYAAGRGAVLGSAGTLRRFRVAVEKGMGQDTAAFAASVETILGDPRGWTASRKLRLQRVPKTASAEFTIYLATPGTSERLCQAGGLYTQKFTSCRLPGKVIVNVARWLEAVPDYGAPLAVYQAYAINHEVGHQLGHGHESCPGPGQPAPVMQQQTLGLKGCVAYAWPYRDGARYTGPAVP